KTLRTAVPYATTRHTRALSTAFFSSMIPPPPTSTLFPYTTLFRSCDDGARRSELVIARGGCRGIRQPTGAVHEESVAIAPRGQRSEEHTSELQSRFDLVCRLLLEKKKEEDEQATTRTRETMAAED